MLSLSACGGGNDSDGDAGDGEEVLCLALVARCGCDLLKELQHATHGGVLAGVRAVDSVTAFRAVAGTVRFVGVLPSFFFKTAQCSAASRARFFSSSAAGNRSASASGAIRFG
ncbi:hypothetical protein [Streptomyces sp. NPDC002573]|uniref:hypothetical protein n=1 Tax=Streptomyces sp. NPDC002573 TaxID=3364651 RepID=UPI00368064D9